MDDELDEKPMTVAQLIKELKKLPKDALVIMSSDGEGNGFSPVAAVGIGAYEAENTWSGQFGLHELTEEDKEQGYSEEDVIDGPLAVCIWPIN